MASSMAIVNQILARIADDEGDRLRRMNEAWEAYHSSFEDKPLKVEQGGFDDNIIIPSPRTIVDISRAFLFGKDISFQVAEESGIEKNAEERALSYLRTVWKRNRQQTRLQEYALNGGVTGHAFFRIVEDPNGGLPRVVNLDPATVTPIWNPDDYEDVQKYVIEWSSSRTEDEQVIPIARRQVIERQQTATWSITDYESAGGDTAWTQMGDSIVWAHPWAPVVGNQNLIHSNVFWGLSDIESDVLGMAKSLNFLASNLNKIIRLHAHPRVTLTGATAADVLESAPDEVIELPMDARLEVHAPRADIAASLGFFEKLLELLFLSAKTPEIALGRLDKMGPVAGVALQILYRPLLDKNEEKRSLYGESLVEVNRRLFAIGGFGENGWTDVLWTDPLPKDELSEAQTAQAKQSAGVSKRTTLTEMGYDPGDEEEARQSEADEATEAMMRTMARNAPNQ